MSIEVRRLGTDDGDIVTALADYPGLQDRIELLGDVVPETRRQGVATALFQRLSVLARTFTVVHEWNLEYAAP